MHHQYGISALASPTTFHRGSSDDVAKCWLFSQANSKAIPGVSLLYKFIQVFFVLKLLCPKFKTESNSSSFFRIGAKLWNVIANIFGQLSKGDFKKHFHDLLLSIMETADDYVKVPILLQKMAKSAATT